MKIITSKNLFLVLCSFFLIFLHETRIEATELQPNTFHSYLRQGIDQLMGRILFNQEEYDRSVEYFQNALKDTSFYNARVRVWAFVRLGMIHDIRKQRSQAQEYYSKALEVEGGEGAARIEAQKYLINPYIPVQAKS